MGAEASADAVATAVGTAAAAEAAVAAATAALPAPPQVLLMPGQTVRSRKKTTTAHRQQMTSRHVRMLPFGGYPAPQNDQLKCRKGKQRLTAGARWEGKMCGATRATRPRRESAHRSSSSASHSGGQIPRIPACCSHVAGAAWRLPSRSNLERSWEFPVDVTPPKGGSRSTPAQGGVSQGSKGVAVQSAFSRKQPICVQ